MTFIQDTALIDEYLPTYDFKTTQGLIINGSTAKVYQALQSVNLLSSRWNRLLFRLRGMSTGPATLSDLTRKGFITLGRRKNQELLLGIVGKFWRPSGFLQKLSPEAFKAFQTEGFAKAAWEFHLNYLSPQETYLSTQTRIQCYGKNALRWFSIYWKTIEPFSSFTRKEILRTVEKQFETSA